MSNADATDYLYRAALAQLRADAEARLVYQLTRLSIPSDPYPVLTQTGVLAPVKDLTPPCLDHP